MHIWLRPLGEGIEGGVSGKTLRSRQIELTDKFARKASADPKFCHWFLMKTGRRSARNTREIYKEKYARCDSLMNSPRYYMKRRLNGEPGKAYGERNRVYRKTLI